VEVAGISGRVERAGLVDERSHGRAHLGLSLAHGNLDPFVDARAQAPDVLLVAEGRARPGGRGVVATASAAAGKQQRREDEGSEKQT
jgi:hypothetical protein